MHKQKGGSAVFLLVMMVLAFSGFFTFLKIVPLYTFFTFLKIVPLYTQDWSIQTVFENVKQESLENKLSRSRVYDMLEKRFEINGVSELFSFVEVSGIGSNVTIDMEYERRVPLISNIELVATFNHYIDISE